MRPFCQYLPRNLSSWLAERKKYGRSSENNYRMRLHLNVNDGIFDGLW